MKIWQTKIVFLVMDRFVCFINFNLPCLLPSRHPYIIIKRWCIGKGFSKLSAILGSESVPSTKRKRKEKNWNEEEGKMRREKRKAYLAPMRKQPSLLFPRDLYMWIATHIGDITMAWTNILEHDVASIGVSPHLYGSPTVLSLSETYFFCDKPTKGHFILKGFIWSSEAPNLWSEFIYYFIILFYFIYFYFFHLTKVIIFLVPDFFLIDSSFFRRF